MGVAAAGRGGVVVFLFVWLAVEDYGVGHVVLWLACKWNVDMFGSFFDPVLYLSHLVVNDELFFFGNFILFLGGIELVFDVA